jgi:hypothetical protein
VNGYNHTYRTEVLNAYLFEPLEQVREFNRKWLQSHNKKRTHEALAGIPPPCIGAIFSWKFSIATVSLTGKLTLAFRARTA